MAASETPLPAIEDPPEHKQGDGPGDLEMYAKMKEKFGDRLNDLDDDVMPRFVRGYATEKDREGMTTERVGHYLQEDDKYHFDTLLEQPWEDYDECKDAWQFFIYGQSKYGHPVVYDRIGCSTPQKMRELFLQDPKYESGLDKIKQYRYRMQIMTHKHKLGLRLKYKKMIYKQVLIFDLAGFTTSHFSGDIRNLVKEVIEEEQHLFPEIVHKLFVINSPFVFRAAWAVIKYFVDPLTYEKIKVLGSDFLKELRKEVSLDQIPRMYGGEGTDPVRYSDANNDELKPLVAAHRAAQKAAKEKEATQGKPQPQAEGEGEGEGATAGDDVQAPAEPQTQT